MFVPPEILLSILEELKTDRKALHNLRLVDKYFCQVATDILFGDFSIHYGFKHSVPQMKSIIKSPGLQPYIRSLHLPSESFFPIAKNFTLRSNGGYRFPWSRDLSEEVEPPTRRNCYEQETDSRNYRGYLEVPTNRKARFTFEVKRYKKEYDTYRKTLLDFLETCTNLRAIHITTGLGYDAERSGIWSLMIRNDVLPILSKHRIRRLDISAASADCLLKIFDGYDDEKALQSGELPAFPSVTSLSIRTHHEANLSYPYDPAGVKSGFRKRLNGFFSMVPNLTSCTVGNTDLSRRAMELLPTSYTYANLSSLNISSVYLTEDLFGDFKSLISSMPSLTDLTLDTISLCLPGNRTVEYYPELRLPFGVPESDEFGPGFLFGMSGLFGSSNNNVPTYTLEDIPATMNWAYIFGMLQKKLPKLTAFSFKCLTYSGLDSRSTFMPTLLVYIPVQDREDYNRRDFQTFARSTGGMELVSTLENDYLALGSLRQGINEKRQKFGLPELKSNTQSKGFGTKNSENDMDILGEDIPQFKHRTENKRFIKLGCQGLWNSNGVWGVEYDPLIRQDLYYWEA
ncbi:hypothetical protein TWF281_011490 [Arthrobotrys megalospora]